MVPFQVPTQHGREGYGLPSTERQHGPSAAENALYACQATVTVPHACAGKGMATRSYQEDWAAPNGIDPPFCSLSTLRWFGHRKTRRRRRAGVPPMPGRCQARVWSSGQAGQAASNVQRELWPRDRNLTKRNDTEP